mmetsp:Transcript_10975/g.24171  ORF Transcript_10975/g.24171 Transcript_10975/m.24171 type:complete len:387 (-) Transcript_10975:1869-3029(-)
MLHSSKVGQRRQLRQHLSGNVAAPTMLVVHPRAPADQLGDNAIAGPSVSTHLWSPIHILDQVSVLQFEGNYISVSVGIGDFSLVCLAFKEEGCEPYWGHGDLVVGLVVLGAWVDRDEGRRYDEVLDKQGVPASPANPKLELERVSRLSHGQQIRTCIEDAFDLCLASSRPLRLTIHPEQVLFQNSVLGQIVRFDVANCALAAVAGSTNPVAMTVTSPPGGAPSVWAIEVRYSSRTIVVASFSLSQFHWQRGITSVVDFCPRDRLKTPIRASCGPCEKATVSLGQSLDCAVRPFEGDTSICVDLQVVQDTMNSEDATMHLRLVGVSGLPLNLPMSIEGRGWPWSPKQNAHGSLFVAPTLILPFALDDQALDGLVRWEGATGEVQEVV